MGVDTVHCMGLSLHLFMLYILLIISLVTCFQVLKKVSSA